MQCQICSTKEATIHLTEINDGHRSEMHICAQCAADQGIAMHSQMPINELLSNLLASQPADEQLLDPTDKDIACPHCGFTLKQFSKTGVLGCPHDYELFEKSLAPLIAKAHDGKTEHSGKIPSKMPKDDKKRIELVKMQKQLEDAVKAENYELAAKLRDQIAKKEN